MKSPVEETKDLLAMHNLTDQNLLDALELGGLPMPSIAVVKTEQGHSKYGPISLVFSKDTIDPQADKRNKVYGGDGYTPTSPSVEYPVNYERARAVEKELDELASKVADGIFSHSSVLRSRGVEDVSDKDIDALAKKLAGVYTVQAAYFADQGKTLEPILKDKVFDNYGNDTLKTYLDKAGSQEVARLTVKLTNGEALTTEELETARDVIMGHWVESHEYTLRRKPELRETRIAKQREKISDIRVEDFIRHAWEMYEDAGATKGDIDKMATAEELTNQLFELSDRDGFDAIERMILPWVKSKLDGVLGDPGIYNGKEIYTSNGDRRSFEQLHYAYTLENIVKAMQETQPDRGGQTWGISPGSLQATASKSYRSIRDIKKDSGRLGSVESEDYKAQMQAVDTEIKSVIQKVRKGNKPHSENTFEEEDIIGTILMDAAKGKKTVDAIVKSFAREDYKISTQTAKDIQALYKAAASLPTEYFEAKPQRAVGLNEVLAAVIPDNSSQELRSGLNKAGVNVMEYETGNDADRLEKVNSVENAKFSLKGSDDYQGLIEKYGAIEQGENPRARYVQVPRQTADGKKVSRTVRTVMEAAATPDAMVPTIQEMVEKGEFSYEVAGDKAAIENAEAIIRDKGFQAALMDWTGALAAGTVSKQNTATGWALYNAAAQAGDVKTAADIMSKLVYHQRNAGQAVQATRILKQMVPGAQLYAIQRSVQNMQDELRSKYGDKAPDLKIPDELVETYLNAESQQERDEAEKEIYISIGKQMPSTFQDKWNAWRYLAMLFNFRTHVRNVAGNAGFAVPVLAKNVVGTALEGIGSAVSGGRMQRTKGVYSPGLFKAAWKDYQNAKPQIMAGGKYDDSVAKRDAIEEGRRIFKNRFLEGLRRFNSGALELEDGWFAKPHYANALAQYCAANKITAEQLETGEGLDQAALDKARAYAIQDAQKATYRDFNDFSDFISSVGRYSGDNKVKKVFSSAVEGVLPFRKTPANILVRAVEYSPIGLIDGMWELTYGVKAGKNTAAEALDRLSAGLTGTGLFSLGVYLAAQGLLVASGDDDDKQKAYDDLLGKQEYAIQLPDGTNFTIDWLAPECIPVFMGAEYFKAMDDRENGGEFSLTKLLESMTLVTNPMLEMSCLSSLNELFDNLSGYKTGDVSSLVVVVANMAVSYLTQGVPTLMGQGERSSQEDRVTTYTDKNKDLPSDWQYTLGKVSAKIPGWDYGQIPYIDAWGQKEIESSTAKRIVNNFVNPAYTSKFQKDKVEGELQRLYTETGESVLPERAERYFNLGDERVDLTGEQYVTYATEKGQRSYALVSSFVNASYYGSQTDGDRTAAIDMLYTYATEQAKKAVFPEYTSSQSWVEKANAAIEEGVKPEVYIYLYSKTGGVESLKDSKGETIKNSKGLQIMEAVNDSGVTLTDKQKALLLDDFGVGKTVIGYNPAKVKQELSKMR